MFKAIGVTLLIAGAAYGQTTSSVPERVAVPAGKSYTGKAFEYTRTFREQNHKHAVYDIRYPSPVVSPPPAGPSIQVWPARSLCWHSCRRPLRCRRA
jgi:hypothetical protein